jgi:hypothetical protein
MHTIIFKRGLKLWSGCQKYCNNKLDIYIYGELDNSNIDQCTTYVRLVLEVFHRSENRRINFRLFVPCIRHCSDAVSAHRGRNQPSFARQPVLYVLYFFHRPKFRRPHTQFLDQYYSKPRFLTSDWKAFFTLYPTLSNVSMSVSSFLLAIIIL